MAPDYSGNTKGPASEATQEFIIMYILTFACIVLFAIPFKIHFAHILWNLHQLHIFVSIFVQPLCIGHIIIGLYRATCETGQFQAPVPKTQDKKCDIYQYVTDGKLPSSTKAQNCIRAEALNYVVINHFLFRIDMQKDKDADKGNSFLLVIPEKYEPIIFNTYHDSLLAGHQGPYCTAMTIRQKFFTHNLMNKVKRYIEACHTCLKTKPKYMKNRPIYGRIPVDYAPMQDLSIDIKTMPQAFGGYHLLLVITCDQTNFTIAVPLRGRTAQTIAEALIYRVIYSDHLDKLFLMKPPNLHQPLYKLYFVCLIVDSR